MKFAEYAKMYAALAGAVLTAILSAPIPMLDPVRPYLVVASVIVTALATAFVENKPAQQDAV
jgi:hypothetical protein